MRKSCQKLIFGAVGCFGFLTCCLGLLMCFLRPCQKFFSFGFGSLSIGDVADKASKQVFAFQIKMIEGDLKRNLTSITM